MGKGMALRPSFLIFLFVHLYLRHGVAKTCPPPATSQFLFPETTSQVLPDPVHFFSANLVSRPLPTNSFFQNFVIDAGDQPEYIHPYLIRSANSSLSISYPSRFFNSSLIRQVFVPDLTLTASHKPRPASNRTHVISSFGGLGVTLDIPPINFRFYLIRGSPFLTFSVRRKTCLSISTPHAIRSLSSRNSLTKHIIRLKNQTWLLYSSAPITLSTNGSHIASPEFSGIIRVAILPDANPKSEEILDRFSTCYSVSGDARLFKNLGLEYRWRTRGRGGLLLLAHPLHRQLLSGWSGATLLQDLKYRSIDGDLLGVAGESWLLKFDSVPVTWHSLKGVPKESFPEIVSALRKDVKTLNSTELSLTSSSYFYGKLIARAARLALVAEEVCYPEAMPAVAEFLRNGIQPWLEGKFEANGFLYERKWGGIVTKLGSSSTTADFGFGIYNDHHFHLGYFAYVIAVLAKIDPDWGLRYKPQAYAIVSDYMNSRPKKHPVSPRLRNFDLWKLHSWAAGLTSFPEGRNQESTSEAVNAYYAAALMGLAYGDKDLFAVGSTLATLEILSAQTWWHVRPDSAIYERGFSEENRVVGILWANMRDSKLWWAPAERREYRLGIQVLPLLPITERLFSDERFARELVEWTLPALKGTTGVGDDGWKGFVYALTGIYDKGSALSNIRKLKGFDDGNSLSNLLWWTHSRGD